MIRQVTKGFLAFLTMRGCQRAALALCLLMVAPSASAIPFTFDARSLGMGGVAVATADLSTAPWANPSMLSRQELGDKFSLLLGIGAFLRDDDDLIGDIDDFQDADDARKDADTPAEEAEAILEMRDIIRGLEDKVIAPEVSLLFSMGLARDGVSVAFSIRGDVIAGGTVTDLSCSPNRRTACDPSDIFDENFNILSLEGVLAMEYGLSVATDFDISGNRLSFGIKPKVVQLRAVSYRESILTIDSDELLDDLSDDDLGDFTTIDMGFAYDLTPNILLGLSVRNLLTDEFDVNGETLDFETEATVGVAYHGKKLTVGVDLDLNANEPALADDRFDRLETQYLGIGMEYKPWNVIALRAGVAQNIASDVPSGAKDPRYTVGIGLHYWFNFDASVVVSDHSVGAIIQAGFRF